MIFQMYKKDTQKRLVFLCYFEYGEVPDLNGSVAQLVRAGRS